MPSATGEQNPLVLKLNMESLFYVLDLAKENTLNKFIYQVVRFQFHHTTTKYTTIQYVR
jgi:hypothetical protein